MNGCRLCKGLLLVLGLVAATWWLKHGGWLPDRAWIDTQVRGQGVAGELLFIAAGALFASVGLPRQFVAFLGGYGFGFLSGTLLALTAAVLGCVASFYYGRLIGRCLLRREPPARLKQIATFIHEHTFTTTLLIRLLPAGSNLLVNLAAGVSRVRGTPFFTGSALGYIPQMAIFALIGSGISVDPAFRIGFGLLLFVLSGALGLNLYRKYRAGRGLPDLAAA